MNQLDINTILNRKEEEKQLCDILNQSLEFMINPSNEFVKRINSLKNEKQCSTE